MGVVDLQTPQMARARVWAAAPSGDGDSMADVAAARLADLAIERESAVRRAARPFDIAAGERLLLEIFGAE